MKKIAIISDPQINLSDLSHKKDYDYLTRCFQHMDVDSVVVCGDITENAQEEEWDLFLRTFKEASRSERLLLIPGNMDLTYTTKGRETFDQVMTKHRGQAPDHVFLEYEGDQYALFGLAVEQNDDHCPISDYQIQRLDRFLERAAHLNIPAIVFGHYVLNDTISINWRFAELGPQSEVIKDLFNKHGGWVFYFSGHVHRGLIKEEGHTVKQIGRVTYISTPSLCHPDNEHYQVDHGEVGSGFMVDLHEESVIIKGYDFMNAKELRDFTWTIPL